MDLQQNERVEEWFLIVGDMVRETPKRWFYALVTVLVVAIPLYMFVVLVFEGLLVSSIIPVRVTYTEVTKQPLELVDKKIFDLGNNTYSGYARVKNVNSEWGAPKQGYRAEFKTNSGQVVASMPGNTFVLPSTEKHIVFPRFSSQTKPTTLDFFLDDTQFIRPPTMPTLSLEIQRRSLSSGVSESTVNAVIVNRTPFKITRVDLPVLLYNNANQVVGVNYTNINDLNSAESRSFQYVWYNQVTNVARIEIIPELNIYNRDIFADVPGQNPFENLE